jgi:hypothetical protein
MARTRRRRGSTRGPRPRTRPRTGTAEMWMFELWWQVCVCVCVCTRQSLGVIVASARVCVCMHVSVFGQELGAGSTHVGKVSSVSVSNVQSTQKHNSINPHRDTSIKPPTQPPKQTEPTTHPPNERSKCPPHKNLNQPAKHTKPTNRQTYIHTKWPRMVSAPLMRGRGPTRIVSSSSPPSRSLLRLLL